MKNERGYALIFVLLTIVLISVIGLSLLTVSSNTLKTSANERVNQSSFYIAEAGVNIKATRIQREVQQKYNELKNVIELQKDLQNRFELFDTNYREAIKLILAKERQSTYNEAHFISNANGTPNAEVTVEYNPDNPFEFKIVSTGHLSGEYRRTLEKSFSIESEPYNNEEKNPKENVGLPELVTPTQPVAPAKIYVNNYLSLSVVPNNTFNALIYHRKKDSLLNSVVTSTSISETGKLSVKVGYNENFTVPTPVEPNISQNFSIDPSISNVNTTLFNTSEKDIPNTIQLTTTPQTLTTDMKVPEIKNNSSHTLNLHVDNTFNLYFFESSLKYNFSNLTFNVTGNGTLNLIVMDTLKVSTDKQFNIQAPNTKVNVLLKKGADIRGKSDVQNIYSHSGEIDVHDRGELKTLDIYSNNGDIDIEIYSKLSARNIYVKEKELKIYSNGSVTAQNIYLGDGDLDMNTNSKLQVNNVLLNKGHVDLSYSAKLQANIVHVKKGNIKTQNYAQISANNLFVNEGNVKADILSKVTSKYISTLNGEVNNLAGAVIVADTINSAKDVRIDAKMNVNTIYANNVYGTAFTRINASEDLKDGHFKSGETEKKENSFKDPSSLISSTPIVEIQ